MFQHTAARRRLGFTYAAFLVQKSFNTQPPEGGWPCLSISASTKACFNTQPPEGGWTKQLKQSIYGISFNTQPPEGGWPTCQKFQPPTSLFQHTAARRRLAV